MAARPLPGASYLTTDFPSPDVDPEAVDSYGSSEKELQTLARQTSQGTAAHVRRRPPVMSIHLLLCCLAFVASAFAGSGFDDQFFAHIPCVPERHAPLANWISATFRPEPDTERVYVTQTRALDILKQKRNSTARVGCHATNVRDYMRQTYSVVESSLHWTNVSQSAFVLHWQGADRKLKPVAITNNHEVLDLVEQDSSTLSDGRSEELADVESAVSVLTAVEALAQNCCQPLRTVALSLMPGEADAQKVSDYLHTTYDECGLEMDFKDPTLDCRSRRLLKMRAFVDRYYQQNRFEIAGNCGACRELPRWN